MAAKRKIKKLGARLQKGVTQWLCKDIHPARTHLSDFGEICRHLRPADVILVEGRSRVSSVIQAVTFSSWTHSALYLGRLGDIKNKETAAILKDYGYAPDQQLILEAEMDDGVVINPLTRYIHDHLRICRPSTLSKKDAQAVIDYAVARLGVSYDVRQVFDLLRFFFPYGLLPRYWRSTLFAKGSGNLVNTICSTLMVDAFRSVNYPVLPRISPGGDGQPVFQAANTRLMTPKDFDYSPYFDVIKYPFYGEKAQKYQDLNWQKNPPEA